MNRRSFLALASGLLVPWQPERVYSFAGGWALPVPFFMVNGLRIAADEIQPHHWQMRDVSSLRRDDRVSLTFPRGFRGAEKDSVWSAVVHADGKGVQWR